MLKWIVGTPLYLALILALYGPSLRIMVGNWQRDDYSHCYIVPFVIGYLVWGKRAAVAAAPITRTWLGIVPFGLGIFLYWAGELGGEYLTLHLSLWLVLIGSLWLVRGWERLRVLAFPLALVLTLFPLPSFLYNKLSVKMQLVSSEAGVWLLQLCGHSAYREGNVIDLGFSQLQVVEACSGLRYLFPLCVLALILVYFFRAPLWQRVLVVLSAVPVTIGFNSLRIALTGILYKHFGQEVAGGLFHDFSGWAVFLLAFALLVGEMWLLSRILPSKPEQSSPLQEGGSRENEPGAARSSSRLSRGEDRGEGESPAAAPPGRWMPLPQVLLAILVLAVTLLVSVTVDFRRKIPILQPLDRFPLQVSGWSGSRQSLTPDIIRELDLTDYTLIDYQNPTGQTVQFYVAYYESQRKGESIHSPETCLLGGGWIFSEAGAFSLGQLTPSMRSDFTVNRALLEKQGSSMLVYFWFPQRGRILTNAYQLKIYTFWDALTRRRTDGALVRLLTPVRAPESVDQAERRLTAFLQLAAPLLDQYLPGDDPDRPSLVSR